jgi:hypothetical protein
MSLKNIKLSTREEKKERWGGGWGFHATEARTTEKEIVEEMGWRERGVRHCLTSEGGRRPYPSFDQRFV